jgi:hypothetical protein
MIMSHRIHFLSSIAVASLVSTASTAAFAQDASGTASASTTVNGQSLTEATRSNGPAEQFGGKGQLAISSDAALSISNTSLSGVDDTTTRIQLQPAVDYFVIRSLSIGGSVLFSYAKTGGTHSTSFGIGPRVGYNIPFSDLVSVWPKIGFSIANTSQPTKIVTPTGTTTDNVSNTAVALNVFVPVMFHPAPHFFAGFGPFIDTDLSGESKATTYGAKLTIGGWLMP